MTDTAAGASRKEGRGSAPALVILVVSLFFIWGGVTSLNDVLVPKLKGLFQLDYAQAMLIQFAFFTAYFVVSVPAGSLVSRLGYGRGMAAGLVTMAAGCLIFFPAAFTATYGLFLGALFVLAAGITILQVAANPLIDRLGPPRTASSRLTFAQAFNSLGTAIMPYLGARLILGSVGKGPAPADAAGRAREAAVIGHAYLGLAVVLALMALVFWAARARLGAAGRGAKLSGSLSLLRRPRLGFGVLAIFLYVGAEVTIGSVLVNFLMQHSTLGLDQQTAGERLSLYWGGAMLGRFVGGFILRLAPPGKVLAVAAAGAAALALIASSIHGPAAGWALIAVGLMNSIMFPTIFSLALEGLGSRTPQGSGLLCMAIVGGAIVPVIGGVVADATSLAVALMVPVFCYAAIAAFGWSARRAAEPLPEISGEAPSIL
ncbi:MAG TPA: sugar MFS transporter [Caulobacteraceae bacterium]|nr:sugar MFS transporter [Caulobacteraceae bacterium]